MTHRENQPKHLVANVVIERGVQIRHCLLFRFQLERNQFMFAREHTGAAQMIQRAAFSRCHQPRARPFGNTG